jgi:hypothetical protein
MHGVACLKCDNPPPPQPEEFSSQLGGRRAEHPKIVVGRELDTFKAAPHIPGVSSLEEIFDARVFTIRCAVDRLSLCGAVRLPDVVHVQSS